MVGEFGEVQVMDWGLAKDLAGGGTHTGRADGVEDGGDAPRRPAGGTQVGSVLGTPAFMPPEQAKGDVDQVDQRSDVFGLGGILCAILTGQPPYLGDSIASTHQLAIRADLGPAFERLNGCGAEPELIDLCGRCLSPDPAGRPADGGAVAAAVAAFRAAAEDRARRAELDRATAEVAAAAERKRRRWQLALAATVLLAVVAGGGGWAWSQARAAARRTEAERRVTSALGKIDQLAAQAGGGPVGTVAEAERTVGLWRQAEAAADEAEGVAAPEGGELADRVARRKAEVADRLRRAEADLARTRREARLLADLDRVQRTLGGRRPLNLVVARRYAKAFADAGLPADATDPGRLAVVIRAERPSIRDELILALDRWARVADRPVDRDGFRAAADLADGNPLRREVRAAIAAGNRDALVRLAERVRDEDLPAMTVYHLCSELEERGARPLAEAILRRARDRYPADYLVYRHLGVVLSHSHRGDPVRLEEMLGCMRAALALKPGTPAGHESLGWALAARGDVAGALAAYRKAADLDPADAGPQVNIGWLLSRQGDLDGALTHSRRGVELDPDSAWAHNNLGWVHDQRGELAQALACYRKAVELDPQHPPALINLGSVLDRQQKLDEALAYYQKAAEADPENASALNFIGWVYHRRGERETARDYYRKAVASDPTYVRAWMNLGVVANQLGDLDEALACHRKAAELEPKSAQAQINIGTVLSKRGDGDGAIAHYRKAIALDPRVPAAHYSLGVSLTGKGDRDEAIGAFREATRLYPGYVQAHFLLSVVLRQAGRPAEARDALREAVRRANPAEAAELAAIGLQRGDDPAVAFRLYRDALAAAPGLSARHRYNAARAAIRFAATRDPSAQLGLDEWAYLDRRARGWLAETLAVVRTGIDTGAAKRGAAADFLADWLTNPDLAPVRDPAGLALVPDPDARAAWERLWADVRTAHASVRPELAPPPRPATLAR